MAAVMPQQEIDRRYGNMRAAMQRDGLDALIVSGNEYTGFEGAVTYTSGFVIVHRYAYVLLPREGDPTIVFPAEARYVGRHGTSWIEDQVFVERPGKWLGDRCTAQRVGSRSERDLGKLSRGGIGILGRTCRRMRLRQELET